MIRVLRWAIVGAIAIGLEACATPSGKFADAAKNDGLVPVKTKGGAFNHLVFWSERADNWRQAPKEGRRILHVYLGGDGRPWKGGRPTDDPTHPESIVLGLMRQDEAPAVFLGRACFHGLASEAPCRPFFWTEGRYAEPNVASLSAALTQVMQASKADGAVLFGASGGGALALLIADRDPRVLGVVTIVANLDTVAWLAYHNLSPNTSSLNPAVDGRKNNSLRPQFFERHYAGGNDTVVPPETQLRGLRKREEQIVIAEYDHNCCWTKIWPKVLRDIAPLIEASRPPLSAQPGS